MKTAIEWLRGKMLIECLEPSDELFEQAKEMENRQSKNYAEFAIHCDRQNIKILNFEDWIKL